MWPTHTNFWGHGAPMKVNKLNKRGLFSDVGVIVEQKKIISSPALKVGDKEVITWPVLLLCSRYCYSCSRWTYRTHLTCAVTCSSANKPNIGLLYVASVQGGGVAESWPAVVSVSKGQIGRRKRRIKTVRHRLARQSVSHWTPRRIPQPRCL